MKNGACSEPKIDYSDFALFQTEVNKFEGIGILLSCICYAYP
jgi:hypothetical protein